MSHHPASRELERRVRDLEVAMSRSERLKSPRRPSRIGRLLLAIATVIGIAVMPALTAASDVFVDVPDGHRFHDEISELRSAGITRGCTAAPPRFCPDDAVSRGQMAALLTRSLGRVWESIATLEVQETGQLDSIAVDPPVGGYVLVTATVHASAASEDGPCPCRIGFPLTYDGTRSVPRPHITLSGTGVGGTIMASGSLTELIAVPPGPSTIGLHGFVESVESLPISISVRMTALFVPFASDE